MADKPADELRRRLLAGERISASRYTAAHPGYNIVAFRSVITRMRRAGQPVINDGGVYRLPAADSPANGQTAAKKKAPAKKAPAKKRAAFPSPLGNGGVTAMLKRRLLDGEAVNIDLFTAEVGCARSTVHTAICALRGDGLAIATNDGTYVAHTATEADWQAAASPKERRVPAKASVVEVAEASGAAARFPAINSVLRVVREEVEGRRVWVTLSDGRVEWRVQF